MYRNLIHTFLISLCLFFGLFQFFFKSVEKMEEKRDQRRTNSLLESTSDRFREFLELPLSISLIGSDYLKDKDPLKADYGFLYEKLMSITDDVSGINLVDENGKITRVFPERTNLHTLGKITQNIDALKASQMRGEGFWLSPPFQLFQGEQGFVIYVPISNGQTFKGWIASVISTKAFADKFKGRQFLTDFDLVVKDEQSRQFYFSTGISPDGDAEIYKSDATLFGRRMLFETWRKKAALPFQFSWEFALFLSFLFSLLTTYTMGLHLQRKRARSQLKDIRTLLNMTAREAVNNLLSEQMNRSATEGYVSYLTDLVEQIDLLQTMSHSNTVPKTQSTKFLPMLNKQLENLSPGIRKKNLTITFDEESLKLLTLEVNPGLFQNSVLSNILGHCIVHSENDSIIKIETLPDDDKNYILFHPEKIIDHSESALSFDRRMEVAKKVLQIYEGELYMQRDLAQGMIIRIILPN